MTVSGRWFEVYTDGEYRITNLLTETARPVRYILRVSDPRISASYEIYVTEGCFEAVSVGDLWPLPTSSECD